MPFQAKKPIMRIGPLGLIVVMHVLFFYAMQSGLPRQAAQAMPRELFVSLITPEPASAPVPLPEAPTPPAAKPKTVPVVKKPVTAPRPIAPAAKPTPLPQSVEIPVATAAPSIDPPHPAAHSAPAAPPAATAPAAPALPKTVSGVEYVQAPQPEYPAIARRMGEEGKVILRILVNEQGQPARIEVRQSSGYARLDDAARRAASRALFKPHLEDGRAVAVYALIPINFSIQ